MEEIIPKNLSKLIETTVFGDDLAQYLHNMGVFTLHDLEEIDGASDKVIVFYKKIEDKIKLDGLRILEALRDGLEQSGQKKPHSILASELTKVNNFQVEETHLERIVFLLSRVYNLESYWPAIQSRLVRPVDIPSIERERSFTAQILKSLKIWIGLKKSQAQFDSLLLAIQQSNKSAFEQLEENREGIRKSYFGNDCEQL